MRCWLELELARVPIFGTAVASHQRYTPMHATAAPTSASRLRAATRPPRDPPCCVRDAITGSQQLSSGAAQSVSRQLRATDVLFFVYSSDVTVKLVRRLMAPRRH